MINIFYYKSSFQEKSLRNNWVLNASMLAFTSCLLGGCVGKISQNENSLPINNSKPISSLLEAIGGKKTQSQNVQSGNFKESKNSQAVLVAKDVKDIKTKDIKPLGYTETVINSSHKIVNRNSNPEPVILSIPAKSVRETARNNSKNTPSLSADNKSDIQTYPVPVSRQKLVQSTLPQTEKQSVVELGNGQKNIKENESTDQDSNLIPTRNPRASVSNLVDVLNGKTKQKPENVPALSKSDKSVSITNPSDSLDPESVKLSSNGNIRLESPSQTTVLNIQPNTPFESDERIKRAIAQQKQNNKTLGSKSLNQRSSNSGAPTEKDLDNLF